MKSKDAADINLTEETPQKNRAVIDRPYKAVAKTDIRVSAAKRVPPQAVNKDAAEAIPPQTQNTNKESFIPYNAPSIPNHIAFIMDGNGRWAQKRLLPRTAGHREGIKTMQKISETAIDKGVKYLSFYAFSTENWSRPKKEVNYLMRLLKKHIPEMSDKLNRQDIKLLITGDMTGFDAELRGILTDAKQKASGGKRGVVNVCLNYGGRNEVVNAANRAVERGVKVDEKAFSALLYTADIPDPDLLIRTGGEKRLSNFMLYQAAYTELYFLDTLWPDFDKTDLAAAIEDYKNRTRKFGKI